MLVYFAFGHAFNTGTSLIREMQRSSSRRTPRTEDYLEAVYHLVGEKGYASTVDISERLGVKPPTVSSMIEKLDAKGYLDHERYRGMRLTEEGERLARAVIRKHTAVYDFLTMIGIDPEVAYEDTEGIEHHLHPVTIQKIEKLVEFLRQNPQALARLRRS
jgi:Mn-dependent DtxR family transcriptional regulator